MKQALVFLLLAASLPGCAAKGPDDVSDETVSIVRSRAPDADFFAMFLNRQTFLFNGDLPADRQRVIGARLRTLGCRDPRLMREKPEEQDGSWSFGRKRVVYLSEWKCG